MSLTKLWEVSFKQLIFHNPNALLLLYYLHQILRSNKMRSTWNGHRISKSQSHSLRLGVQSNSQFMLRSGLRINTVAETMQHIKKTRVKSYQKISFNIRKMDEIFKPKRKNPESFAQKFAIIEQELVPKKQQTLGKIEKLATCMHFYDAIKFKKNIVTQPDSPDKQQRAQRIKTQHFKEQPSDNRDRILSNLMTFRQQPTLPAATTSILKSSFQEEELMARGIPGIQFKKAHISPSKTETNIVQTSKGSLRKSMEKLSAMTKASSYLHADELLQRDEDHRIGLMYNIRQQQQLFEEPKQWQFYNCLKLSQLSLYRSNLKLSCENWVLIDYLELKYIRGWIPKEEKQTKIAIQLFITSILMNLQSKGLDCRRLNVRINNSILDRKLSNNMKDWPTLHNNTILSLWDLFIGMIYTKQLDITWHIIYFLAYIHKSYNIYVEGWSKDVVQYSKYIFIETTDHLKEYEAIFITLCQEICSSLNLTSFSIQAKPKKHGMKKPNKSFGFPVRMAEYLSIKASCIEIAILFMECIKFPTFLDLFTNPNSSILVGIRYQVGFHFWQDRTHVWKRDWQDSTESFYLIGKNNENGYFSAISYNKTEEVIVILNDCKPNMIGGDCQSIFKWMRTSVRRFKKPQFSRQ